MDISKKKIGKNTQFVILQIKTKKYFKSIQNSGIKNEIETIHASKEGEYGKYFIKIKFDTDDNLPLNTIIIYHKVSWYDKYY